MCGSRKYRYSGSRESKMTDARKDENEIVVEAEIHRDGKVTDARKDENEIVVEAEIHRDGKVTDARKDENEIVVEADKYYAVDYVDRFYIERVVNKGRNEGFY